ncbi:serine/threonine-protein kinase [Pendulispora albinea]|uniref:Protein kinase n=1 Tax=Pendulispora albinea TaxID=2741071 RepID=A0ABZ2LQZ1_9BACT
MAATGPATQTTQARLPAITKYEVIEEIGHGGMATVYRAHDPRLGRDVAIKVIHRHLRDSSEIAHRFFAEARAVAKLRHENIVEVYDVSSPEEDEQYLVVELVRGRSLRKILEEHRALPPEVGVTIALELLAALAHAHAAGVIHRDVKPENVILEYAGAGQGERREPPLLPQERVKIKLTDFGIAKLLDSQGVTSTGQVLGSPAHMAPEQIEGGEVDARADVFGTGVLLYECLAGHLPFEGSNPAQVLRRVLEGIYPSAEHERPIVGKNWSKLLDRALHRTPEGRFQDANQMREALLAELRRLQAENTLSASGERGHVEAWLDDPEAYTKKHDVALIARLCELGHEARARGDAVAAAADYNRALAYAPHDKTLLKIVSTMHRSAARRRLVKRIVPIVLSAIVCGTAAFWVARAFKPVPAPDPMVDNGKSAPSSEPLGVELPNPEPPPIASGADPARMVPAAISAKAPAPRPVPAGQTGQTGPGGSASASGGKAIARDVTFRSLIPLFGVRVALDGDEPKNAEIGGHLSIDGQKHVLVFSCAQDACEHVTRVVEPGEDAVELAVTLEVKPAILFVQGDPRHSYAIQEQPTVVLRAGVPNRVPMKGAKTSVHVLELPAGRSEPVTLLAGQQVEVVFGRSSDD